MLTDLEKQLFDAAGQRSLWFWVRFIAGVHFYCKRMPADNWLNDRRHRYLCDWHQAKVEQWAEERETVDDRTVLIYLLPRGTGKTQTITVSGSTWMHRRWPDLVTALGSYNNQRAQVFLDAIATIMEGRASLGLFEELYGNVINAKEESSDKEFTHIWRTIPEIREPSYSVVSVQTGATGTRPDVYNLDDPIRDKPQNLLTEIENATRHVRKYWPVLKPNGLWIVPCTRKGETDPAGWFMKEKQVKEFAETGLMPPPGDYVFSEKTGIVRVFFMKALDEDRMPTFPNIHSKEGLEKYEADDPVNFASEMQNSPTEGRHTELTEAFIDQFWVPRNRMPPNLRWVMHLDCAFKSPERRAKGDENVIALAGHSKDGSGDVYLERALTSNLWTSKEFFDKLAITMQELLQRGEQIWAITKDKPKFGEQGLFQNELMTVCHAAGVPMPRLIELDRHSAKDARVATAKHYVLRGKCWLVRGNDDGLKKWRHQMVSWGFTEKKDVADALADTWNPQVYRSEEAGNRNEIRDKFKKSSYADTPIALMTREQKVRFARERQHERRLQEVNSASKPWWVKAREKKGSQWKRPY